MSSDRVEQVCARLGEEAAAAEDAWPETWWRDGRGRSVTLRKGRFQDLQLHPGERLDLTSTLAVPERIHGVDLPGEPLELYVSSLYPVQVSCGGGPSVAEFSDEVAPGPSLVEVTPALEPGAGRELHVTILVPQQQTADWLQLRFSTPGLRHRHEVLDVAWARLALAAALAGSPADEEALERAAATVPGELGQLDLAHLEEALAPLGEHLAPFAERIRALRVHVIGHSHIDMNWLWTWEDTERVIRRDLRTLVELLDAYPELTFTHSQAATYDVIRRKDPDVFAGIQRHVRSGRWEVACLQWVESDLNIPSGEALEQQFLEGIDFARKHLGVRPTTLLAPDTFGHSVNFPQLAVAAGARRYYHHRCNPGGTDFWPAYRWEGADGTRLLTMSTPSYNGQISAGELARAVLHSLRHGLRTSLYFHGIGDHGGGPTRQGLEALRRFRELDGLPDAFCSTLEAYGDEVEASNAPLPVHIGELNPVFEGCYTTQAEIKTLNRAGENELTTAGTLDALAGTARTGDLREAWRLVLFNQFHDILCGSSIHEAYPRAREELGRARAIASSVRDQALPVLAAGLSHDEIAVTNPLGWEREDVTTLPGPLDRGAVSLVGSDGVVRPAQTTEQGLIFIARAGAFATERYRISTQAAEDGGPEVHQDPAMIRITTRVFDARIDRESGAVMSLIDRRIDRELAAGRGQSPFLRSRPPRPDLEMGVLQLLDERYHGGSAWQLAGVRAETSLVEGAVTEVVEQGPVRVVVEARHQARQSEIVQRTIFYSALPRVDYETRIEWREPAGPEHGFTDLKVAFTADLDDIEAWFETPFAALRRAASGREVAASRWAGVGDGQYGIAVLNQGRHGYDALGPRLRLTLLHGSSEPDAIADLGVHVVRYSLLCHLGGWREAGVTEAAAGYNQPLLAHVAPGVGPPAAAPWRPRIEGSASVLLESFRVRDGGGGIVLRIRESAGRRGQAELRLGRAVRAWNVTPADEITGPLTVREGRLHLTFGPWQVRSVLLQP